MCHDLSVWNMRLKSPLKSHLLQNLPEHNLPTRGKKLYWNEQHFSMRQKSCRRPFYCSDLEHIYFTTSFPSPSVAVHSEALSGSRKFRSPKMNLNAFLCRFPTVFGKYIRILDQVNKIRRFHSIPFEFQGFENRPQICFLPFRILYSGVLTDCINKGPSVRWTHDEN